jgi:hypothetical protein
MHGVQKEDCAAPLEYDPTAQIPFGEVKLGFEQNWPGGQGIQADCPMLF